MASLFTRNFTALLAAQACFGFSFSSFFLLPKFMTVELHAGPDEIGSVTAAFYVTAVVLGPWMGTVVDRRGRRRFLTAGALLQAVAAFGFVAVDQVGPLLYALRMLQGAAFAMAFVAGSALAVDEAPAERLALALGIFGLTMLSNNAIAPVLVEVIGRRSGWGPAFALAAVMGLASAALSLRLPDRARPAPDVKVPGLLEVATRPGAPRMWLVVGLAGAAFGVMFTYPQPFALQLGMENVRSFFVAYTAAALLARLGLGPFTDRLGRRRVTLVALVLYTASTAAASQLGLLGLAAVGAAFGLAHGIFYPTFNALAVQQSGEHERGKAMALFNGAFNVGYSFGVFGLGLAAARLGYPPVFWIGAGSAAGAFLVLLTRRRRRSPPAHPASAA
jgi:MFS family permease